MASVKFLTLLAVLCTCSGLGHGEKVTTQKPVMIDIPKHPVLSVPEAPVPKVVGAEHPTTIEPDSTISTTSPPTTTSTTTPPPTTTSTTTPPPTTTSTTTPPTTTAPPAPPKPTPAPTPAPTPTPGPAEQGTWSYTDKQTNITCVVVQFAAQLNISYFQGNSSVESHRIFNFPANATVTGGSCNGTEQWIELSWPASNATNATMNKAVLVFDANETRHDYEMKAVNITLSPAMLVNVSITNPIELYHGKGWQLPMATSYRCTPATYLKMTSGDNIGAVVTVTRLQEEAFRKTSTRGFSAARECGGGDVPDAVPIAVGCALAGLVVVVVVAYLVARRRSAVRGYLSM